MLIRFALAGQGIDVDGAIVRAAEWSAIAEAAQLLTDARGECNALRSRAEQNAQDLVKKAQQEAEATLRQAEADAIRIREDAAREARAEIERGYADGERRAAEDWHERHAALLAAQQRQGREAEQWLVDLVMLGVGRIVEAGPREALFARALETVRSLLRGTGSVTLRVAQADATQACAAVAAWYSDAAQPFVPEVRGDALLAPGTCIFSSELGTLDTSLQAQLAGLRGALDRAVHKALAMQAEHESPHESNDETEHGIEHETEPV